jgi:hypothetical protein
MTLYINRVSRPFEDGSTRVILPTDDGVTISSLRAIQANIHLIISPYSGSFKSVFKPQLQPRYM